MKHDERQFLDLLLEFRSDETKKARRNVSVIAFTIISIRLLGLPINEIRVFGVDLSKSGEVSVLVLAFVLLLYWALMFYVSWAHDQEIQKERSRLLDASIAEYLDRFERFEKEKAAVGEGKYVNPDYKPFKRAVEAYRAQQKRTAKASEYGNIMVKLEYLVPSLLCICAVAALASLAFSAL